MNTDSLTEKVPYATGAGAGVGAYLLGYLVSYVALSGSVEDRLAGFNFVASVFGGDPITAWQAVGWLFYNAHFVRTKVEGGIGGPRSENFIAASDDPASILLYLLPIALLVAAGFLLARYTAAERTGGDAEEPAERVVDDPSNSVEESSEHIVDEPSNGAEEPADGAIVGASVVLGYFPLAVIGAFLFSYEGAIAPDLVTAVLLAGLVYPLLFGAIGGVIATMVGED